MIPLGYLYKQISSRPDWLKAEQVTDVYALSGCVSKDFADYIGYWKNNGYGLFNSPKAIHDVAQAAALPLDGHKLFYYEAYELQYDEDSRTWSAFEPEPSLTTDVVIPKNKTLEGFDVTSFSQGNIPECSPLSCNGQATEIPTNKHCLLGSLDEAKAVVERDAFRGCEPGPYRIIAVYSTGN